MMAEDTTADATRRLNVKKQTLDDAYAAPANFLEIDVVNPITTMGVGKKRYTDYEVRMRTNLPVFKVKESSVRRRYSDFEWLRNELERDSKIVVPPLPGKALKRQLPFRGDDGIFEEEFIEDRRKVVFTLANKQTVNLMLNDNRCPWTPTASKELQDITFLCGVHAYSLGRFYFFDFEGIMFNVEYIYTRGHYWTPDYEQAKLRGLEVFINKIAGHPLAQNERCLHMFLQEPTIDKNYVPGKIRNT